ncbi:MAG TPA: nucleoside hydrolase [Verrucomicrobiae bacterium]|nr:nucleoside hydrolase [Verrucomicrobiae bacterium]
MSRPLIIDTDPGIDDALAILLACASPELELQALTTVAGNVPLARVTENALKLLELGGKAQVPVYAGSDAPLARKPTVAQVHGTSGMDGADLPPPPARPQTRHAVDHLVETLSGAAPKSVTLAAIGPLTNVAAALQRAPGIGAALAELVIMGGATSKIGGNMSSHAEFNIFVDPEAAAVVFASGLPITLVPLDLSHQMLASLARIERFAAIGGPVGQAVAGMLRYFHDGDGHLHDPLTIAWLLRPDLFTGRRAKIHIETSGTRDGETVFDWREDGNCRVLLEGKDEDFFDFLIERLARL